MSQTELSKGNEEKTINKRKKEEENGTEATNSQNRKLKRKRKKIEGKPRTKELNKTNHLSIYAEIKKTQKEKNEKKKKQRNIKEKKSNKSIQNKIKKSKELRESEEEREGESGCEVLDKKAQKSKLQKEKKKKKKNIKTKNSKINGTINDNCKSNYDSNYDSNTDDKNDSDVSNHTRKKSKKNKKNSNINNLNSEQVSPFDYERLLVSEKNKSAIWISYIVYYLEKGNIDNAREVAERALKTIDIHEVDEKLNIYLCYLNMECVYGDRLNEIFKRALLCNNEKSIYLHTINILKINKKLIELKELCEEAIKKFKYSKKIWSTYLEILHSTYKDEEYAHSILLKSLYSLPKKKHLNMIINAARFEYKYSNKERGKAYFEKLIQEYPKRSDVWFTYLDIHINSLTKNEKKEKLKLNMNELQFIRNIFERFISIKFKTRVMKMIFTKWLLFEKNQGSVKSQKLVQEKAYNYVESLNSTS
ncbi:rRNA biogenesis protein RRP5 [Plasmodium brasilianum]|uniref:rRNA biogenesis protein RRP5 n=1 Tax=Plasmodium brasilianum TaxID=5824 RepID=A0ACB9Y3E9_PLABR|nr:rRNA biogenesis protein RRP5 [Plasmodium brasilianum]